MGPQHLNDSSAPSAWHGMMSSVVAASNGALSGGRFKALAPDLGVVLVKVGTTRRIHHDDQHPRHRMGAAQPRPLRHPHPQHLVRGRIGKRAIRPDTLSRFAEAAVRAGIAVVAAVVNPRLGRVSLSRSSYGPTIDGLQKPEVVTLADGIAAPLLP